MKTKNLIYTGLAISMGVLSSCDTKKLVELNKNPNAIETVIPAYSFTALVLGSNSSSNYGSLGQGLQYYSTYKEIPAIGDKFYSFGSGGSNPYTGNLNRIRNIIEQIPGPENVNKRAACIMLRVFALHNYTDAVGDFPYSEAEKGLDNLHPKYDRQKDIYAGLLKELETALTSMDATKPNVFGTADPYFQGDVAKWKKYGYTLMLRMGMRMSEVDPANSKIWVQKAIAGGVMTAASDIAYQKYADVTDQMNGVTGSLQSGNYNSPGGDNIEGGKYAATFINHLKATKDPRLSVIAVVWKPTSPGAKTYTADTLLADQRGMINGSVNGLPADFDTYSEPSLLYLSRAAPILALTPAEAYLLLAEAALRGWYTGATAKECYDLGVTRAMQQWALWPTVAPHSGTISQAKIDSYLLHGYPYDATASFEKQLEQIMTQKWVSLFGQDYEVWSEWRRTKYPVFNYKNWRGPNGTSAPSFYPGNVTGGKMFRRFPIGNENSVNKENYLAGLAAEGFPETAQEDLLQGRMWWDTPARGDGQMP